MRADQELEIIPGHSQIVIEKNSSQRVSEKVSWKRSWPWALRAGKDFTGEEDEAGGFCVAKAWRWTNLRCIP